MKELSSGTQGELVTPLHPRILQLSHVMDSHVSERVKSKVYQLARQYSLRIKSKSVTARPPQPWEKVAVTTPHLQPEAGAPSAGRGMKGVGRRALPASLGWKHILGASWILGK